MPKLIDPPPYSPVEVATDFLHGISVVDPYRWLEDQDSPRTRVWIEEQIRYGRNYLDAIPGRRPIRQRLQELLDVETYDSLQICGANYFFRKRLPEREQPCIYMREKADGEDRLLIDPLERGTGKYTAVLPHHGSPNGRLLLYEIKEGGERMGTFELLDIATRSKLPDSLPHGYLRGFAFAPDSQSFYYVLEALDSKRPFYRAAYRHFLGTPLREDVEIFSAGEEDKLRLTLVSGGGRLVLFVHRFLEETLTDVYVMPLDGGMKPEPIFWGIHYSLGLRLLDDRILAITNRDAPNRRIVEISLHEDGQHQWRDIVPETDTPIGTWLVVGKRLFVSYKSQRNHSISIFDLLGQKHGELPFLPDDTVRMVAGSPENDELLVETQSFTRPVAILRYYAKTSQQTPWAKKSIPFDSANYGYSEVWYTSKDGTRIHMYLAGRRDILTSSSCPTIMTSYGGYGVSMTPRFSVFVAFLMERGCLFALPNIRGGSEFGVAWHEAAKRRNRQTAYDDFLAAAEWLIESSHSNPQKLAIFGGSNSGLLVGAAVTQRPGLFRAAICMVPILDMLRYHLFNSAYMWKDEFGAVDEQDDFTVLAKYSPYHQIQPGIAYPAMMLVSGDADQNCNPLHARKMTARLQAANVSVHPIFLDYTKFRGHSPVLPLSTRVNALTDRLAFLCDQLQLLG